MKSTSRRTLLLSIPVAAVAVISFVIYAATRQDRNLANFGVNTAATRSRRVPELTITKIVQHGHIVEIEAKVEPGATVMVNGETAAALWEQSEIKHFVGPLPDGINDIAITVQTDKGDINSKHLSVVMP